MTFVLYSFNLIIGFFRNCSKLTWLTKTNGSPADLHAHLSGFHKPYKNILVETSTITAQWISGTCNCCCHIMSRIWLSDYWRRRRRIIFIINIIKWRIMALKSTNNWLQWQWGIERRNTILYDLFKLHSTFNDGTKIYQKKVTKEAFLK